MQKQNKKEKKKGNSVRELRVSVLKVYCKTRQKCKTPV